MSNNSSSLFILIKSSDLQKEMKVSHKTGAELFVVFTKKRHNDTRKTLETLFIDWEALIQNYLHAFVGND